nr:MAG TPA_asm: hypothetical protein [Caudoviricetes sp.]
MSAIEILLLSQLFYQSLRYVYADKFNCVSIKT